MQDGAFAVAWNGEVHGLGGTGGPKRTGAAAKGTPRNADPDVRDMPEMGPYVVFTSGGATDC